MRYPSALLAPLLFALAAFAPSGFTPSANAAPGDFQADKPTALRVVLQLAPHPNFTPQFLRDYKRDVRNGVQEALGPLGTVDVVYESELADADNDPLVKLVRNSGLAALGTYAKVDGDKTHFVQLEFKRGRYQMLARQYDGSVGFATPLVRSASTTDRAFLTRMTSLLIGQDFGITADLSPVKGETQTIRVRGGNLAGPTAPAGLLDRWVHTGDLFALVALKGSARRPVGKKDSPADAGEITAARVEGVLLQVTKDPVGGQAAARLISRFADPLPTGRGIVGYRAVRLGTTDAPLKLKLVDENKRLVDAGSLSIQADGRIFPEKDGEGTRLKSKGGIHESTEVFPGVAFVRITLSDKTIARIPIEILDENVVVRQIRLEVDAEAKARLEVNIREMLARLSEARVVQEGCFADLLALEKGGKNAEALTKAESVQKTMTVEMTDLREQLDQLIARQAATPVKGAKPALDSCDNTLLAIRNRQNDLGGHIAQIRASIELEKDPAVAGKRKEVQDLINQAESLYLTADYDNAIARFDDAIARLEAEEAKTAVAKRRDDLKALWATRSQAHAAARRYIYENWPRLDTLRSISEGIPKARAAFEECKKVGDKLTLNKLNLAAVDITSKLGDIGNRVTGDGESDRALIVEIRKATDDLLALLEDVQKYAGNASGS